MPKLLLALMASVAAINIYGAAPEQARLLVSIMVDGLDSDYLDLLRERFGNGGFRRLEREGVALRADYGTTLDATAATAEVSTGAAPSVSGIAGKEIYDRKTLRPGHVYSDASALGNFTNTAFAPRTLRVSTLSDEIRIASGGTNLCYTVAPDPGMAISMAGHTGNCALWPDPATGNWASSTFYEEIPIAVAARNRAIPLTARLDTMSWTPSLRPEDYPALPDHLSHYPFRYVFPRGNAERLDMFMASPMLNREITALATDILRNNKLGTHDGVTDVLNLGFSLQPFNYGKNADKRVEMMDAYIKLDRNLEQIFAEIDKNAGAGNSMIVLSATPPRNQRRRDEERWGIPTGEFSTRKAISLLNVYLMALHGNGDYVSGCHGGNIYLNHDLIKERKLDIDSLRSEAATFLAKMTGIDRVFTIDDIVTGHAGQNAEALRRNTVAATAGDIVFEPAPGFEVVDDFNNGNPAKARTGMVHIGATTTAPVFIVAPGVAASRIATPVDARSIAPTVARLLRIRSPNGAATAPLQLR